MRIGKVVGNVVSTVKDPSHAGYKLMIVDYLDNDWQLTGNRVIVFDAADAGIGDVVLCAADGGAAMEALKDKDVVADIAICGVIDRIDREGRTTKYV
mgnify:CR=1 FL=1